MPTTGTERTEATFTDVARLHVENIGGIEDCSVELKKGVTLLTGRNATNRTSLLQAITGVLGGTAATLKSDADSGQITLELGEETYTRTYERTGAGIDSSGDPYETNEEIIDLFISLLENNPARLAVERGDELRDLIMRPVDTEAIEQRIRTLQTEREELSAELESVERQSKRLPTLEERRQSLESELESIDEQIDALRTDAAEFEADAEMAEEAEELVDRLDDRRQELSEAETDLELVEAELDALRERPAELRAERDELEAHTRADLERVQDELRTVRGRKRTVENTVADLSSIVEFNEDVLSDSVSTVPSSEADTTDPVAELAPKDDQEITCWTCGNQAERGTIEEQLENLRRVVSEKQTELGELTDRIEALAAEEESVREAIETRERLDREIEDVEAKLESKRERREAIEERIAALRETVSELESEVAVTEDLRNNDLLKTYERISDLQYERGQKREQLGTVQDEIDEIEALPDKSRLKEQIEEIRQELRQERKRVDELESRSVSQFNEHMEKVLDILDYRNVSRVWIERKEDRRDDQKSNSTFDLHIIRESESGSVYEDTVENLSESEREVIGLIVALAGYLVHDVYEEVPFMLADSLEAIDSERIADLIEYFSEYAPYLVVALLPEDASGITDRYMEITADELN
ncbi:archaea-specific SMC-related protein [Natrinema salaciae]|uniref:AAA domain-containing protein n=1 Tax=Natrinema salaciae TaxID=1186196 RepID=A0A1H9NQQ3_9EURY|nr:archaea-specific SMC-related protein [Natrinema salaciae]SER38077.1 AAA domain-containing protein [Natrinema salaciae]